MTSSRPWPSRKACAAAPTRAAPPSPPPRRTNGSARPSSASARARRPGGSRGRPRRCAGRRWSGQRSDGPRQEGGRCAGRWRQARAQGPSLKMRAVGYLSRREHAREAGASCRRSGRDRGGAGRAGKGRLAVHRAFRAEPRASARVAPGAARIVQELRQHGVDDGGGRIARPASVHRARARAGGLAQALRRKAGRPRGLCQAGALRPAAASRRMSSAAYWAARATKSRPASRARTANARPQTPVSSAGPKRQVSGHRRQAYCAQPLRPDGPLAGHRRLRAYFADLIPLSVLKQTSRVMVRNSSMYEASVSSLRTVA